MAMTSSRRTVAPRSPLAVTLVGLMLTLAFVGCDRQAQKFARMQTVLDEAMAVIADAESGSIPADTKPYAEGIEINPPKLEEIKRHSSYGEYRQSRLDDAVGDLQTVASSGSPTQKAVALRMLAAIDTAAARDRARQATQASADLTAEASANLVELLAVIERTDAAGNVLEQNDAELVEELNKELASLTERRDALADQVKALNAERDTALSKEKAQRELSAKKVAEAQAYASQAFEAEGDRKYELLDKESAAKREAAQASIAADAQEQAAEALAVELKPLEQRLSLLNETIESVKAKRDTAAQRQEDTNTSHELLASDRDKAFEELVKRFERLTSAYDESVAGVFDQAQSRAESAVDRLEQAENLLRGGDREGLEVDRLTALGDLADIHARRAVAASSMAKLTKSLIDGLGRTGVPEQSPLPAALERFDQARAAQIEAARAAVGDAEALANSIGSDASTQIIAQIRARAEKLPTS
jgi:chromosome segregation ATPase